MNLKQWCDVLWQYIRDHHHSGQPIYLAFDKFTLVGLYPDSDNTEDAMQDLNAACQALFVSQKKKSRYSLDPRAFTIGANGLSLILPFAVQQVLAAEEMVAGCDYSADTYYLHYCHMISNQKSNVRACPLKYADFSRIWSTLKNELTCQLAANEQQITFKQGLGNKEKYRNLPISQALLSINDLNVLCQHLEDRDFHNTNILINRVRLLSNRLSARGKQKVYIDRLAEPVLAQLSKYYQTFVEPIQYDAAEQQKGEFIIAIETAAWTDSYVLYYRIGEKIYEGLVNKLLLEYFAAHQLMVFIPDYWGSFIQQPKLLTHNNMLVLYQLHDESLIETQFKSSHTVEARLPDGFGLKQVTDFTQFEHTTLPHDRGKLSFAGGLAINNQTQQYLLGYPPTAIEFNKQPLPASTEIIVNGEKRLTTEFLQQLLALRASRYLKIEYMNTCIELELIDKKDKKIRTRVAYQLNNGYLEKTPVTIIDDSLQSFSGLGWQNSDTQILPLCNGEQLSRLLNSNEAKWKIATKEELAIAQKLIIEHINDVGIREKLTRKFNYSRKLPAKLLLSIRQAR